jgi:hypothetical protein
MNQNFQSRDQGRQDPNKKHEKRYPYDEGKKHLQENLVDDEADLIYQEKHWQPLNELRPDLVDSFKEHTSPLSKMLEGEVCEGVLHITGDFFPTHKQEIINAIRHSDTMARERDSMNRVMKIVRLNENDIAVFTTKNQLAVTIGRKLDSAFKGGKLDISWSKGDKEVEVRWQKDTE